MSGGFCTARRAVLLRTLPDIHKIARLQNQGMILTPDQFASAKMKRISQQHFTKIDTPWHYLFRIRYKIRVF